MEGLSYLALAVGYRRVGAIYMDGEEVLFWKMSLKAYHDLDYAAELVRQLIDELQKPENNKHVNKNLGVELQFGPLADILEANKDFFHAQRIQQGRGPQQAKQDVAIVLELLRYF